MAGFDFPGTAPTLTSYQAVAEIKNHLAFYPDRVDEILIE